MRLEAYSFEIVYHRVTAQQRDAIVDFWLSYGAIDSTTEARRRSHQVVVLVRNPTGEIVGLSSVGLRNIPRLDGWHYIYRMFIRPADRVSYLMKEITNCSRDFLRSFEHPKLPMRGLLIVTENRKLMRPGLRKLLLRHGYQPLGRSTRGLDWWRVDFRG